jgi:hypothetical protein
VPACVFACHSREVVLNYEAVCDTQRACMSRGRGDHNADGAGNGSREMPVKITENAACVLSGSDLCCYRTVDLINKDVSVA